MDRGEGFVRLKPKQVHHEFPYEHRIELIKDGEKIGQVLLVYHNKPVPLYHISFIGVKEDERGKGYGVEQLENVKAFLKEKGKTGILSDAIASFNSDPRAIGMYARHGWEQVPGKNLFVFNLPTGVSPEKFIDWDARHMTRFRRTQPYLERSTASKKNSSGSADDIG